MIQKVVYLLLAAFLVSCEKQSDGDPQVKKYQQSGGIETGTSAISGAASLYRPRTIRRKPIP